MKNTTKKYTKEDCEYCLELSIGSARFLSRYLSNPFNRIIYEDDNIVIVPSLGQIIEGYILIIPKEHIISYAYYDVDDFDGLKEIIYRTRRIIKDTYGTTPILFEHGPVSDTLKGGCCIDHGHIHIVPVELDIYNGSLNGYSITEKEDITDIISQKYKREDYIYFENNVGNEYILSATHIESQIIRKVIAKRIGMPHKWNWREYIGENEILATYNKLKGKI